MKWQRQPSPSAGVDQNNAVKQTSKQERERESKKGEQTGGQRIFQ